MRLESRLQALRRGNRLKAGLETSGCEPEPDFSDILLRVSWLFWAGLGLRASRVPRLEWNRPFLRTRQLREGGGRHLPLRGFHYLIALMVRNIPKENDDDGHANNRGANSCAS